MEQSKKQRTEIEDEESQENEEICNALEFFEEPAKRSRYWEIYHYNVTTAVFEEIKAIPCSHILVRMIDRGDYTTMSGIVRFKNAHRYSGLKRRHKQFMWDCMQEKRVKSFCYEWHRRGAYFEKGLPAIHARRNGSIKGGNATRSKWLQAYELAKEGRLEEIEPYYLVSYYDSLKAISEDYKELRELDVNK